MHKFLVGAYNSQDFAQTPEKFARSHNRETMTYRNSDGVVIKMDFEKGSSLAWGGSVTSRNNLPSSKNMIRLE